MGKGISENRGLEAGLKRSILSEPSAMVGLSDTKTSLSGRKVSSWELEKIENKIKP